MTFKSELENLAKQVAKRAAEPNTPFTETIDALKALSALFGIISKKRESPDEEPGDGFTMESARSMIEEPRNGESGAVRSRSRRSSN